MCMFCRSVFVLLSFCTLSFGHCVVCSFSIYRFWVLLWYLQILLFTTGFYVLLFLLGFFLFFPFFLLLFCFLFFVFLLCFFVFVLFFALMRSLLPIFLLICVSCLSFFSVWCFRCSLFITPSPNVYFQDLTGYSLLLLNKYTAVLFFACLFVFGRVHSCCHCVVFCVNCLICHRSVFSV